MWLIALLFFPSVIFGTFADKAAHSPPVNEHQWSEHRRFFEENGYLWIKNFFSAEQVKLLQIWSGEISAVSQKLLNFAQTSGCSLESIIQNFPGALIVVPEASNPLQVCRAEDFLACCPSLYDCIAGSVLPCINYLQGEPYVLFKDKINFKWPGGGAFPPHQDFPAYEFLGPREHVTAMICVDAGTIENGCLQVAKDWKSAFAGDATIDREALKKGRAVLPYIVGGKAHGSIEPKYSSKISWLPLLVSPGDLVLISSFVPHYSEVNKSEAPRRAMFFTFNRLMEGDHRGAYYHAKRNDPNNPIFHIATPTKAHNK